MFNNIALCALYSSSPLHWCKVWKDLEHFDNSHFDKLMQGSDPAPRNFVMTFSNASLSREQRVREDPASLLPVVKEARSAGPIRRLLLRSHEYRFSNSDWKDEARQRALIIQPTVVPM